jgi:MFS transporter, PPP family, 3-phenylpropionic acid transporter
MQEDSDLSQTRSLRVVKGLYFFYFGGWGIFTVFINVYYHEIGLSGVQIGWINSIAPLVGIIGGPLLGMLSDRIGRPRLLMLLAVVGSTIPIMGISAVRTFIWLIPLAGIFQVFNIFLSSQIDVSNLSALEGKNEKYGQQRIWGSIGYIIVSWIAGLLLERFGLHWMFNIYLVIMVMLLGVSIYTPQRRIHIRSEKDWNIVDLVGQRAWLFFAASVIPLWMSSNGMYTFLGVYLKEMGANQELIGLNSSIGAFAEIPVMLLTAFLVRKAGIKRMLAFAYLMYALRFLFYGLMPSPVWALPIALMHGVTFGLFWTSGVMYLNQLSPVHLRGTAQSMFVALLNLGSAIGSPVSGWMFDNVGPAQLFQIFSGLCLLALTILLVGFRTAPKPAAEDLQNS